MPINDMTVDTYLPLRKRRMGSVQSMNLHEVSVSLHSVENNSQSLVHHCQSNPGQAMCPVQVCAKQALHAVSKQLEIWCA
jgi:hypothetical protein